MECARPPSVAGAFCPADAHELIQLVGRPLAEVRPIRLPAAPKARRQRSGWVAGAGRERFD
jgi:hypothetical protein